MDWKTFVTVFSGSACAAVLTSFASRWTGKWTRMGQHDADFDYRRTLQSTQEALRRIESRISGGLWRRQTIYAEKRECYYRILHKATEFEIALSQSGVSMPEQGSIGNQLVKLNALDRELRAEAYKALLFVDNAPSRTKLLFPPRLDYYFGKDNSGKRTFDYRGATSAVQQWKQEVTITARQDLDKSFSADHFFLGLNSTSSANDDATY